MKKLATKGFTLIELLVVITIIGILATGATAVYTSAQQKARDSIRQNDVLALRSAVEQSFGDKAEYPAPTGLYKAVITAGYMQALPSDPKSTQTDNDTGFDYIYAAADDEHTDVKAQEYEVSANFENTGNATSKEGMNATGADSAVNSCDGGTAPDDHNTNADGGQDGCRWEIGVNMDNVDSSMTKAGVLGTNTFDATADVDSIAVNSTITS